MSSTNNIPKLAADNPELIGFAPQIQEQLYRYLGKLTHISHVAGSLKDFADTYQYLGLNYDGVNKGWWYREWAPAAYQLFLTGEFNFWDRGSHPMHRNMHDVWEIFLPDSENKDTFKHGSLFKVVVQAKNGTTDRIPVYVRRVVQDEMTKDYSAQVWSPTEAYVWKNKKPSFKGIAPLIYEAHVGMGQEEERVGTYLEFAEKILPRIKADGYNYVQFMAIQEHPYYGSFGYHVSSYYAPSSRFGTPEDLKYLIDTAHGMGIGVILDTVHSHAVKNIMEGLAEFDGTDFQYFHSGPRGYHEGWDSKLFDYGKWEVQQFLLGNLRYWMEEFNFDGFRFDGITSMLYHSHGLSEEFSGLEGYFGGNLDHDAVLYLQLANELVHELDSNAITIAEDVSGFPGLCRPQIEGGIGFDYRLAMGLPDYWIRMVKDKQDEDWDVGDMWGTLINRRKTEKTIAYVESHDQALVGDQTMAFRLIGPHMYAEMAKNIDSLMVDRGIALHKIMRLVTAAGGGEGYINFMGNEWGHPDWIDFPRVGNDWSYRYARRQWSLADSPFLRYHLLGDFDKAMIGLLKEHNVIAMGAAELVLCDHARMVLVFERGGLLFMFNFHPSESYFGLSIPVVDGVYQIVLNSDAGEFGGFGRIKDDMPYETFGTGVVNMYLPSRTALVLKKE